MNVISLIVDPIVRPIVKKTQMRKNSNEKSSNDKKAQMPQMNKRTQMKKNYEKR